VRHSSVAPSHTRRSIGEEPHIAYNRVGLTQYFGKRDAEALYLNPLAWYSSHAPGKLTYHTSDPVLHIDAQAHTIKTQAGKTLAYDVCVVAVGSDAALPPYITRERFHKTTGAFVYRNLADLDSMIAYSESRRIKRAGVVGGGLREWQHISRTAHALTHRSRTGGRQGAAGPRERRAGRHHRAQPVGALAAARRRGRAHGAGQGQGAGRRGAHQGARA
jgi:NAD(P)H-nitrite reductase large subunit